MPPRVRVEHDSPAERVRRRDAAHDQPVPAGGDQRLLEAQLVEAPAQGGDAGRRLARAVVDLHPVLFEPLVEGDVEDV